MHAWMWAALGLLLIGAEMLLPGFVIIWPGLAALLVAGLMELGFLHGSTAQLLVWAGASALAAVLWFMLVRPRMRDRTQAGLGRELVVGQLGTLIDKPQADGLKTVRFSVPVLSQDEWPARLQNEREIAIGERVRVVDVLGNTLLVCAANQENTNAK